MSHSPSARACEQRFGGCCFTRFCTGASPAAVSKGQKLVTEFVRCARLFEEAVHESAAVPSP